MIARLKNSKAIEEYLSLEKERQGTFMFVAGRLFRNFEQSKKSIFKTESSKILSAVLLNVEFRKLSSTEK